MLDLLLVPTSEVTAVATVASIREATIASDHFLVFCKLQCEYRGQDRKKRGTRKDLSGLTRPSCRQGFTREFAHHTRFSDLANSDSVEETWSCIGQAFGKASESIPDVVELPHRPWISNGTVKLIEQRTAAPAAGQYCLEKTIHKAVRRAAKRDKGIWLDDTIADGSWQSVRKLLKPTAAKQGRLRNLQGELVSSEERANTLAEYLETVQWRVRPATVIEAPLLGTTLPVPLDKFSTEEVRRVLRKLQSGRSKGPEGVPTECWKILAECSASLEQIA